MELVPILSTIILVGTIATFILAVAAYILYKIREGRAHERRAPAQQARQEPHVLVSPQQRAAISGQQVQPESNVFMTPGQSMQQQQSATAGQERQAYSQRSRVERSRPEEPRQESLFWEYTDEGFVPVHPEEETSEERRQEERENEDGYAWL